MNDQLTRRFRGVFSLAIAVATIAGAGTARADDLKDGRNALAAGNYDQAIALFEKAASQGYAGGREGVGEVWLKRHQYAKAMDAFQTAQKMDPGLASAYWGQGEVLRRQSKCGEAVPLLQKAVDLDKRYPDAALALGDCLVQTNQRDRAVQVLSAGLKWGDKWRPRFLVALGNAELARDSLRAAGVYFTQAREDAPDDPVTHRALGDFYTKRGTFELAIPEYQAAIAKDTTDVELRYALGQAQFYAGATDASHYQEALETYKDVVRRDPDYAPGQLALGDLLYRSGQADHRRYVEAREPLAKYVAMQPDDPKGWSIYGRTLGQLGERDSALVAMDRAEQLGDKTKDMFTMRARIEVAKRDYDKALADFGRGKPEMEDQFLIAQIFSIQGQPQRAESLYTSILAQDSTSKFALRELGKARFRAKNYDGAIQTFGKLIALDPSNDEAYYYEGLSYNELKRYPEALGALQSAARLGENKADRQFWLGILYAQLDSTDAASRALSRAIELDSTGTTRNTAIALRQLGYYDLLKKSYADAVQRLSKAASINNQDVQTWVWLGQAYQNSGQKGKACETYDKVLSLAPGQPDAVRGKKALGC